MYFQLTSNQTPVLALLVDYPNLVPGASGVFPRQATWQVDISYNAVHLEQKRKWL